MENTKRTPIPPAEASENDSTASNKQEVLQLFVNPEQASGKNSSAWKKVITQALPELNWEALFIRQGGRTLTIGSRTVDGNATLRENSAAIFSTVAKELRQPVAINPMSFDTSFSDGTQRNTRFGYTVACLVVSKPRKKAGEPTSYENWMKPTLGKPESDEVKSRITKDLYAHLCNWCPQQANKRWASLEEFSKDLNLNVESYGRPMPLKGAVVSGTVPITPMARLEVKFSTPLRIRGFAHVGLLTTLGFGRAFLDIQTEQIQS